MRARIRLTNPDDVEATVAITMTLGEWKRLREQIDKDVTYNSPADRLRSIVRDLVAKAEAHFDAETGQPER